MPENQYVIITGAHRERIIVKDANDLYCGRAVREKHDYLEGSLGLLDNGVAEFYAMRTRKAKRRLGEFANVPAQMLQGLARFIGACELRRYEPMKDTFPVVVYDDRNELRTVYHAVPKQPGFMIAVLYAGEFVPVEPAFQTARRGTRIFQAKNSDRMWTVDAQRVREIDAFEDVASIENLIVELTQRNVTDEEIARAQKRLESGHNLERDMKRIDPKKLLKRLN